MKKKVPSDPHARNMSANSTMSKMSNTSQSKAFIEMSSVVCSNWKNRTNSEHSTTRFNERSTDIDLFPSSRRMDRIDVDIIGAKSTSRNSKRSSSDNLELLKSPRAMPSLNFDFDPDPFNIGAFLSETTKSGGSSKDSKTLITKARDNGLPFGKANANCKTTDIGCGMHIGEQSTAGKKLDNIQPRTSSPSHNGNGCQQADMSKTGNSSVSSSHSSVPSIHSHHVTLSAIKSVTNTGRSGLIPVSDEHLPICKFYNTNATVDTGHSQKKNKNSFINTVDALMRPTSEIPSVSALERPKALPPRSVGLNSTNSFESVGELEPFQFKQMLEDERHVIGKALDRKQKELDDIHDEISKLVDLQKLEQQNNSRKCSIKGLFANRNTTIERGENTKKIQALLGKLARKNDTYKLERAKEKQNRQKLAKNSNAFQTGRQHVSKISEPPNLKAGWRTCNCKYSEASNEVLVDAHRRVNGASNSEVSNNNAASAGSGQCQLQAKANSFNSRNVCSNLPGRFFTSIGTTKSINPNHGNINLSHNTTSISEDLVSSNGYNNLHVNVAENKVQKKSSFANDDVSNDKACAAISTANNAQQNCGLNQQMGYQQVQSMNYDESDFSRSVTKRYCPGEWMNKIVEIMWPFINVGVRDYLSDNLAPMINWYIPPPFNKVKFENSDLGTRSLNFGPFNVFQKSKDIIQMDVGLRWESKVRVLDLSLLGASLGIDSVLIDGTLSIHMPLLKEVPILGGCQIFMINQPKVELGFSGVTSLIDTFPLVVNAIRTIVAEAVSSLIVLPNATFVPFVDYMHFAKVAQTLSSDSESNSDKAMHMHNLPVVTSTVFDKNISYRVNYNSTDDLKILSSHATCNKERMKVESESVGCTDFDPIEHFTSKKDEEDCFIAKRAKEEQKSMLAKITIQRQTSFTPFRSLVEIVCIVFARIDHFPALICFPG